MSGSRTIPNQMVSAALAALAIAVVAGPAMAQVTSAEQSALRANCRSDFISHCSGISPGGKDALVCLQKNVASLSANCQKVVRETLPKPAAPKAASAPARGCACKAGCGHHAAASRCESTGQARDADRRREGGAS